MHSAFGVEHGETVSKARGKVLARINAMSPAGRRPGQGTLEAHYIKDSVKRYGQAGKGVGYGQERVSRPGKGPAFQPRGKGTTTPFNYSTKSGPMRRGTLANV